MQHEIICKFPSDHFYNKKLRAAESVENRPPVAELEDFWQAKAHPIIFCDVVKDEREYYSLTEDDTGIDDITLEKLKKEIKKSNKVRRERKTDFHSKFNPGQATITVSFKIFIYLIPFVFRFKWRQFYVQSFENVMSLLQSSHHTGSRKIGL